MGFSFCLFQLNCAFVPLRYEKVQYHTPRKLGRIDRPAAAHGLFTYHKYNEGSLYGMWVDLVACGNYDTFIEVCHKLHADESDPELMFQDYENFPEKWYSESCMDEDTFDNIMEFAKLDDYYFTDGYVFRR